MPIDAEGSVENLKYSIERYLNGRSGSSYTYHWEGTPQESTQDEFIQETILNTQGGMYHRQVEQTSVNVYGQTVPVLLSLNIFVKKVKTTKTNRHYEIRDDLMNILKPGETINMYDFASGNTTTVIQIMKVREIVTDQPISDPDYHQWSLGVEIDWLSKW